MCKPCKISSLFPCLVLKVGLAICLSRTNADSQWNPVYTAFHRNVCRERFVGSSVNVILTQQTCGQRSSRAAESKRRVLENYVYERICYIFLTMKCRGDWDLGLCTFCAFAKRKQLRNGDFRKKNVFRLQKQSEFGIARRFSFRKYPKSAQT